MKNYLFLFLIIVIPFWGNDKISIGTIDSDPDEKIYKFQFLADYLEKKLKNENINFEVEIAKNMNTAITLIKDKKLDIFIDSVYPTMLVKKETDIDIICKRWKKGIAGYRSVIYTKIDSPINTLEELKGKIIAFEDEHSTTGYYISKKHMIKLGLKFGNNENKENVKYKFSRSEQNSAVWVRYGKVDAAVTDDNTYSSFNNKEFKVIYKSKLIPRHLVSFSKSINKQLQKKIINILFNMHNEKKGIEVLKKFSKTKKFSKLNKNDIELIKGI